MRTVKYEKKLKSYDELTKEEKEKVLDNHREINLEFPDWSELTISEFVEDVNNNIIFNINSDDVVWAVGDRDACFGVYGKKIIEQVNENYEEVLDINVPNKVGVGLTHKGGGICKPIHTEYSRADVDFEDDISEKQKQKTENEINEQIDKVIDKSREYFDKLNQEFQYLMSDEAVADTLRANDYEFDSETLQIS